MGTRSHPLISEVPCLVALASHSSSPRWLAYWRLAPAPRRQPRPRAIVAVVASEWALERADQQLIIDGAHDPGHRIGMPRVTAAPLLAVRWYPGFAAALAHTRRDSRNWWRCRVGILALNLVDRHLSSRRAPGSKVRGVRALRRALPFVTPAPLRSALAAIVDHVARQLPADDVLGALETYGERLNRYGWFALASDVYQTAIAHADDAHLPRLYERFGYSRRELGDTEAALTAYRWGRAIAERAGDEPAGLRLHIAQAHVEWTRGQLDDARDRMAFVLARAQAVHRPDLIARAAHESGCIAHESDDATGALSFFALAIRSGGFASPGTPSARDRLLLDIGRAFAALRIRDVAQLACDTVKETAVERYTRWAALINLIDIAVDDGDERRFDAYRLALADAPMPSRLLAAYHWNVGVGLQRFGRDEEARPSLLSVIRIAHRMNDTASERKAAQALEVGRADSPRPRANVQDFPAHVAETARAVQDLGRRHGILSPDQQGTKRLVLRRGRPPRQKV